MDKLPPRFLYFILFFIIFAGLFYWFQVRPSNIKQACAKESQEAAKKVVKTRLNVYPDDEELKKTASHNLYYEDDYDTYFKTCLQKHGL